MLRLRTSIRARACSYYKKGLKRENKKEKQREKKEEEKREHIAEQETGLKKFGEKDAKL